MLKSVWEAHAHRHINLLELWEVHLAHNCLASWSMIWPQVDGCKVPKSQGGTQSPSLCRLAISLLAHTNGDRFDWERGTCFWCDHAHHGCSFSFRERSAVKSACWVLPGMSPQPRGVGPSSPAPESSGQLFASSRNFYLRHTFLGRRTSMSWSGLLALYAVPAMVLIQRVFHKLTKMPICVVFLAI